MKKIIIYAAIIIAFFILGLVIANFVIMPSIVHMGEEVVVPNVCNLPLEKALEELEKKRLEGVVTERRYDFVIEEGKIIIQDPLPDASVKVGRIINLTVSLGPETVRLPFLTGVDYEKGKLIVERLGLIIESVEYLFSDSIAQGKIMKTIPDPEVEMKKGDEVKLIVSKGLIMKMPDLSGMSLEEAQTVLHTMDLVLGEVKEVEGSGTKGSIILHSPEPEQIVNSGDTISVMVIK
jgi:beta-lactam-binding protein with PASTA domain